MLSHASSSRPVLKHPVARMPVSVPQRSEPHLRNISAAAATQPVARSVPALGQTQRQRGPHVSSSTTSAQQTADKTRVLFVCLGNICRSPTAEAVFKSVVERAGKAGFCCRCGCTLCHMQGRPHASLTNDLQAEEFDIDSCGTGGGNPSWCFLRSLFPVWPQQHSLVMF